jgi:hypothetical protein
LSFEFSDEYLPKSKTTVESGAKIGDEMKMGNLVKLRWGNDLGAERGG